MKSLLVVLLLLFVVTGCDNDTWKEKTAKSISTTAAPITAKLFSCANEANIELYFYTKLRESKLLKKKDVESVQKSVGSNICNAALEAILPPLVNFGSKKLPADWECTGSAIEETGKLIAKEVCDKIKI